jgi:transposase-like protein
MGALRKSSYQVTPRNRRVPRKRHWLWRAVDQQEIVLDILVQQRITQLPNIPWSGA